MGKLSWSRACTLFLVCATTAIALCAQDSTPVFSTLHSFNDTDGASPVAALLQATDGNLYGTTDAGGANGYGTVFKITLTGTLTTLYSFCSLSGCPDGQYPGANLLQATDGNLYGTTAAGGANGYGTVFKITPRGILTTLYSFCSKSGCTDGESPHTGLIQATDGNFYGTTETGGANGYGSVFKITPGGALTTLHSFDYTDGDLPYAGVVQGKDGNFYGTTEQGGAIGNGTVFKVTPTGTLTTLYSFCSQANCTDGYTPAASPVQATDGNFYGTTAQGGANGYGTVFKLTPNATLTTLHSFDNTDGLEPLAGLVQATDGNFYGTTLKGGTGRGTVFKITASGTLTTLYSFCSQSNCADGSNPEAGLVQDTNGSFYGTTQGAASTACTNGCGTVFTLSVGLGPFVEPQPASGKVGAAVKILGTNLTGSTLVTFNGTAATFKVVSSSLITTTVPAGATSGKIQVTTPTRTLSSNVSFRVLP